MNAKLLMLAGACALAGSTLAAARTNTVKTATSDWTNPANFTDSTWLPGSGDDDTVIIPANATVSLSDADAASLAQFMKLKRVLFASEASELDITVGGSDEVTIPVPITQYLYVRGSRDMKCGPLVKKGSGTLHLSSTSLVHPTDSTSCFDYYSEIRVDAGTLKLQQNSSRTKHYLGRITVAAGAKAYLPDSSVAKNTLYLQGLAGAGEVTSVSSVPSILLFQGYQNVNPSVFSGVLSGAYNYLQVEGNAQTFSGNASTATFASGVNLTPQTAVAAVTEATLGVGYLTGAGANGSLGYNVQDLTCYGKKDARVNYVGPGGTANVGLVLSSEGHNAIIGAEGTGALTWSRLIQRYWHNQYGQGLVLSGSYAGVNQLTTGISDNYNSGDASAAGHSMYLSKEGATTWNLGTTERTSFFSGISVNEGVLQYGTIAPAGTASSLGLSTFLTDGTLGKADSNAEHRVGYAIRLGAPKLDGTSSDSGRLEYVGTADFLVTNRPIAVAKAGGLRNNGTAAAFYSGVSGLSSEAMTLYLDGSGTNSNTVHNVSDGTGGGKLSVVKEGTGTWVLAGAQTWTGSLDVRGGRLIVSNPQYYRWYKWCVTALLPYAADTAARSQNLARLAEFALCAADKTEVTRGYPTVQQKGDFLAPGTAALVYTGSWYTELNGTTLARLFDGMAYHSGYLDLDFTKTVSGSAVYTRPTQDDPETWLPFVIRLPADAPAIVGYDYANMRGSNYADSYTTVSNYFVEASLDGVNWTRLVTHIGSSTPCSKAGCDWMFAGQDVEVTSKSGTVREHNNTNWDAIDSAPATYPSVLEQVGAVSVSGGATLELEAGSRPVTLDHLKIDASAAEGTIRGFTLASAGTLEVTGFVREGHETELPLDLAGATDAASVANWTLRVNGQPAKPGWTVTYRDGKIVLSSPGAAVILR